MAWRKYFSVEVPLFLTAFSFMLEGAILTNLYVYRTCYVTLGYNETECNQLGKEDTNVTEWLEPLVQPTVNQIHMAQTIVRDLIPLIFCMCVGSWSDKFGRKPFLILTLSGLILSTIMNTLIIHFPYVSPWWFIISIIPSLLTGGPGALLIVISSYLADVTTKNDRVVRFGIFEVILSVSSFAGNFSSSYLLYATSYEIVFSIEIALSVLSLVYTIFFIPESLKQEKKAFSMKEVVESISIKSLFRNFIRKRENHARPYVFTIMSIYILLGMASGEMSVTTLFLRAKLYWNLEKITIVNSITSVFNIFGTLCSTFVLYKTLKINELKLCLFAFVMNCGGNLLKALAVSDYYIFAANLVGIFNALSSLMLRTQLSLIVAAEEMGKIFAMLSIIMSIDTMISGILYPLFYNATLNTYPGSYNFISLGVHLCCGIIVIFLMTLKVPHNPDEVKEHNQDKVNKVKGHDSTINILENLEKEMIAEDSRRLSNFG